MQPRIISSGRPSVRPRYSYANPVRQRPARLLTVNACRPAGPKFAFKTIAAGAKMKKATSLARSSSADKPG